MKLIIVRHAESIANSKDVYDGNDGGLLTKRGRMQAKAAAGRLKKERIDKIFVSDLKRAVLTAEEIIKFHPNAHVFYEPLLKEQDVGEFAGKPYGTLRHESEKSGIPQFIYKPPGGESIKELDNRIKKFLRKLLKDEDNNKTILLVIHGGSIIRLMLNIFKDPDENYKKYIIDNTAVSVIDITKNSAKLIYANSTSHLGEKLKSS